MIGWKSQRKAQDQSVNPRGFDDFELRLGDIMRGERATMGKSLLDVQRELRIKASYIAAIENCDPSSFDTPGFIAGYVRSYARYLNMDPDETFAAFCAESGFSTAHGMSEAASSRRAETGLARPASRTDRDFFVEPKLPFAPAGDSLLSRVEPGAIGSSLVLVALIAGIGYGGWSVLQEVQRVQLAPVEQTPVVLADIDPVQTAAPSAPQAEPTPELAQAGAGVFTPPSNEALDRLYRPQALDVPVLVARDAPISTLDPSAVGAFAGVVPGELPRIGAVPQGEAQIALSRQQQAVQDALRAALPQVADSDAVKLVAVRPVWIRVRDAKGAALFQGILNAGDTYDVPQLAEAPTMEVGESGALYFALGGQAYGPAGERGQYTGDLELTAAALAERYAPADTASDDDLRTVLADLSLTPAPAAIPGQPRVLEDIGPGVTIVATREAWVRVRSADGSTLFETVMQPGATYAVPMTEQPPTIRTGDAGAIYFAVNGQAFGPYGSSGAVADNLALSVDTVTAQFQPADMTRDTALARVVAELNGLSGN